MLVQSGRWVVASFATAFVALLSGCLLDGSPLGAGGAGGAATTGTTPPAGEAGGDTAAGGGGGGATGGGGASAEGGAAGAAGGEGGGPSCGDGSVDDGEVCDDGNDVEGDGCFGCQLDCGCPGCAAGMLCPSCGPNDSSVSFKDPATSRCYAFVPGTRTWTEARDLCEGWGGALAGLSTAVEMGAVLAANIIEPFLDGDPDGNARCWTGGNDRVQQGNYEWVNGEGWLAPPDGPSWNAGEPNGGRSSDCIVIGVNGTIRDRDCQEAFPFLCERTF
jgi:cysteine-rich repeat protein